MEILNHASSHINYLSRFLFSRIGCAFAKFAKYKRLENNPLYGTWNAFSEQCEAKLVHGVLLLYLVVSSALERSLLVAARVRKELQSSCT